MLKFHDRNKDFPLLNDTWRNWSDKIDIFNNGFASVVVYARHVFTRTAAYMYVMGKQRLSKCEDGWRKVYLSTQVDNVHTGGILCNPCINLFSSMIFTWMYDLSAWWYIGSSQDGFYLSS